MRDIVIKPICKDNQWYTGDTEKDNYFLKHQINYANELLKHRGYLFLNDVYDMLGYARTKTGQFWVGVPETRSKSIEPRVFWKSRFRVIF